MKLIWNVYIEDFNKKCIKTYNIFEHYSFKRELFETYNEFKGDKDKFLSRVKQLLQYYYWSKCEWEIILSDWPPSKKFNEMKISVYDQIENNWHIFSEYIWNNRDSIEL